MQSKNKYNLAKLIFNKHNLLVASRTLLGIYIYIEREREREKLPHHYVICDTFWPTEVS
jgi:DUF2075 family protein